MRSTTSSHVFEKLITLCPQPIFDLLFQTYFAGRFGRLAGHPVANFVCARAVERANAEQTQIVVDEIPDALEGIIENSRTGVVKALLDKVAVYKVGEEALNKVGNCSILYRLEIRSKLTREILGVARCFPYNFRRGYSISHTVCTVAYDFEGGSINPSLLL
jgi:hypothetical protein